MTQPLRLGILASHTGTNLQAIIDACKSGQLDARVCAVISNNSGSGALRRARREGIPSYHLSGVTHPAEEELDSAILSVLESHDVDLVVLAGYMKRVGPRVLARYDRRILNTHPALLPRFGGEGMYGRFVHEAVLASGVETTGATVHLVDERYDHGPVIARREVPVLAGDTVDTLRARVLREEHRLYVETLRKIAAGDIDLDALGG